MAIKRASFPAHMGWMALILVLFLLSVGSIRLYSARESARVSEKEKQFESQGPAMASKSDHYLGSLSAPVHLILYSDPECPYCKEMHQSIIPQIRERYGESVVIAYRHHLLPRYTRSPREAEAMECAGIVGGETAFWKYLDALYARTPSGNLLDPALLFSFASAIGLPAERFQTCLETGEATAYVNADREEAAQSEIVQAPTVVLLSKTSAPIYLSGTYPRRLFATLDALLHIPER